MAEIRLTLFALIRGNDEALHRLVGDKSIYNFRDVRGRNPTIKKVIGFN